MQQGGWISEEEPSLQLSVIGSWHIEGCKLRCRFGSIPNRSLGAKWIIEPKEKVFMMKDVDEGLGRTHCSSSATLVSAMRILANEIQSDDGVANAAIREAADRIEQLETSIKQIHKDYGCEIRDPCGTIWEYASRLEKENAELKSRIDA